MQILKKCKMLEIDIMLCYNNNYQMKKSVKKSGKVAFYYVKQNVGKNLETDLGSTGSR